METHFVIDIPHTFRTIQFLIALAVTAWLLLECYRFSKLIKKLKAAEEDMNHELLVLSQFNTILKGEYGIFVDFKEPEKPAQKEAEKSPFKRWIARGK